MPAPKGPRPATTRPVIDALIAHGPLTMSELAARATPAKKTLRNACSELESADWLEQRDDDQWGLGPAAQVLALSASREAVRAAIVDGHGDVLEHRRGRALVAPLHTAGSGPDEVVAAMTKVAQECLAARGNRRPAAVALSWPGPVSRTHGGPKRYANEKWPDDLRLDDLLEEAMKPCRMASAPRHLVNDADAEVLAECRFGVARDDRVTLGIKLSGGIGSALVISGELYEGDDGSVGEIGHVPVNVAGVEKSKPDEVLALKDLSHCSCGVPEAGHLERFASGRASLARLYKPHELADGLDEPASRLSPDDTRVHHVLRVAGKLVGRALSGPYLLLEPDAIVVSARPYSAAVTAGVEAELEDIIGRSVTVKLGTSPDAQGDLMAARGAAAYAFDKAIRPAIDAGVKVGQ